MDSPQQASFLTDAVGIEFLILADHAEVLNGKIYMMGGGWDVFTVRSGFPARKSFAIAMGVRVPWEETNRPHRVEVRLVDEDNQTVAAQIEGDLIQGRPAMLPQGHSQVVPFALQIHAEFKQPAEYAIRTLLNGEFARAWPFRVIAGQS
jgi:hypothetical protein